MDMVGFFRRTANAATAAIRAISSMGIAKRFCNANTELLHPTDVFVNWPAEYLSVVEHVTSKLETFLNVRRIKIDPRARFKESQVAGGKQSEEYLETVKRISTSAIFLYQCTLYSATKGLQSVGGD